MKPKSVDTAERVATVENGIEDVLEESIYDEVESYYDDVVDEVRRDIED